MTGKEHINSLKKNVLLKMSSNGWEAIEISAEISFSNNRLIKRDTVYYQKDGKTKEKNFGLNFTEYEALLATSEGKKINHIYIRADSGTVKIYANVAVEEFGLPIIPFLSDPQQTLYNCLAPHLTDDALYANEFYADPQDGLDYFFTFFLYTKGQAIKSGKKYIMSHESKIPFKLALIKLSESFTIGKKTKVFIRKDMPLEIIECDVPDLLEDIKCYHVKDDVVDYDVLFRKGGSDFIDIDIDGVIKRGGKSIDTRFSPKSDFRFLYLAVGESIKKLRVHISKGKAVFYADHAYPEYGILRNMQILKLDSDDLTSICKFIESGSDEKLKVALNAIASNDATRERLNARYLNYVKAFLGNKSASLQDMTADMFSKKIKNLFLGRRPKIGHDFIDFSYCNKTESKYIIDFIGAMTRNFINIDDFIKEHKQFYTDNDTKKQASFNYKKWFGKLKEGIENEADLYPEGWFSQIYLKLLNCKVVRILTDKSEFFENDEVAFIKEYMFFLNSSANGSEFLFDVYNTLIFHDLTEIYWMFKSVPDISWFQSPCFYPKSPYGKSRKARMRIDNGKWENVSL